MNKEEAKSETQNQNPNSNAASPNNPSRGYKSKGKSCKGFLYYSSVHKSKSQKPTCVGIPRTLQHVPSYIIGISEFDASDEGRPLKDFMYACVGYSFYLDNKDSSTLQSDLPRPRCVGFRTLAYPAPADQVPANIHKNEDSHILPQSQSQSQAHRSTQSTGDEFYNRFKSNARIVASGAAKNLNKIGNQIKETLDDILSRRPK